MKVIEGQRYQAAEPLLRRVVEMAPKFAGPFNDLGVLLMQQKKYAEAEQVLQKGLEADPKFVHALLNLGITLNHLQRFADAVAPLREVLRLQPGVVAGHLQLGIALVETDQFPEAEQELTRALKARDADPTAAQLYLGKLYARTGEFEKSIAALKAYLEKAPNAPNADEVRALIQKLQGRLTSSR